jgi:hypothetical protein
VVLARSLALARQSSFSMIFGSRQCSCVDYLHLPASVTRGCQDTEICPRWRLIQLSLPARRGAADIALLVGRGRPGSDVEVGVAGQCYFDPDSRVFSVESRMIRI